MPTPIGHIAAGALLFQTGARSWRRETALALAVTLFALLPDIDLAAGLLLAGNANIWHHQATHSLLFVLAAAAIGGWCYPGKGHTRLFAAAGLLHLIFDLLAKDTTAPFGAPLFWPFWSGYSIAPLQIFSDVHRSGEAASFLPSLFTIHNLRTVGIELLVMLLLWSAWYLFSHFKSKSHERTPAA
ncbi:MAG TPA: metal-dependent hydrolase [bacterium]|nr:metal-dependent hydrolase [bacterium]HPR87815.1 metal-dependent hydrolase [bacterium]